MAGPLCGMATSDSTVHHMILARRLSLSSRCCWGRRVKSGGRATVLCICPRGGRWPWLRVNMAGSDATPWNMLVHWVTTYLLLAAVLRLDWVTRPSCRTHKHLWACSVDRESPTHGAEVAVATEVCVGVLVVVVCTDRGTECPVVSLSWVSAFVVDNKLKAFHC